VGGGPEVKPAGIPFHPLVITPAKFGDPLLFLVDMLDTIDPHQIWQGLTPYIFLNFRLRGLLGRFRGAMCHPLIGPCGSH
jgi:hypothetical protein